MYLGEGGRDKPDVREVRGDTRLARPVPEQLDTTGDVGETEEVLVVVMRPRLFLVLMLMFRHWRGVRGAQDIGHVGKTAVAGGCEQLLQGGPVLEYWEACAIEMQVDVRALLQGRKKLVKERLHGAGEQPVYGEVLEVREVGRKNA